MGEAHPAFFEPSFNRAVKITSRDDRLSSNAGALALREADHRLGLVDSLASGMFDRRDPEKCRYALLELLRGRIYSFALGYSAWDDADSLAHDPVVRLAVWDRPGLRTLDERLQSQPTQSRLLAALARHKPNLEALRSALADWIERHLRASGADRAVQRGTIDVDGFPVSVHGEQEGGAYNGYYGEKVYYPLAASFAPEGDYDARRPGDGFVHAILRRGNAAGAEGALRFMLTAYRRCAGLARVLDFRLDAAFTIGTVMDGLKRRNIRFVGRLRNNAALDRLAAPYLTRPPGRPPKDGYECTVELGWYRADSWTFPQRVVLVVVDKPDAKTGQLELFPRHFFLVTSWQRGELDSDALLAHYRRRGTFEDRFGELSKAISLRLSSPGFAENEANFLLALLRLNLAAMLRREIEKEAGTGWDLGRLQRSVLHAGARVVTTARRVVVDVAQAVVPLWRLLFACMERWRLPDRWPRPRGPRRRHWIEPPRHAHRTLVLRI
jgi:hypothetical protein